jgi:hypothetical protein
LGETNIVRILNAYLGTSLVLFIGLVFCACSPDFNPTRNLSTSSVDLELLIPAKLAQSVCAGKAVEVRISLLPLFSKARKLVGTWRLNFGQDAEFPYSFRSDGRFENRVGGAFFKRIAAVV